MNYPFPCTCIFTIGLPPSPPAFPGLNFLHQEISRGHPYILPLTYQLLYGFFFSFIKAGHIFFGQNSRCSGKTDKLQNQGKSHTPSRLDWLIKYSETFKHIRLFIYEEIISFSSVILLAQRTFTAYIRFIIDKCNYILSTVNATLRELSRNVNRTPVAYWNTQTVLEIRIRPSFFCHLKIK